MPLTPAEFQQLIRDDLTQRLGANQLRQRRTVASLGPTRVAIDGVEYISFSSNDYLGLTHHPLVIEAAESAARNHGTGSGASALITGHTAAHRDCEVALAQWKQSEDAILFPSGYQANLAAIQTLAALAEKRQGVRFLVDKLAHASLIDAARAVGAEFRIFPHNHLGKLQRLLEGAPAGQLQVVLTESIFSMDGDAADLAGLVVLKERIPFLLLLDEAHGSGVYGAGGAGYAAELGLAHHVDINIATLSKAIGCGGGAICASKDFCAAVVNYGRAYIYSTSVPPMVAAAVEAALGVMRAEPQRQARLREIARRVRGEAAAMGFALPPGDSPIVPIILGEESAALEASKRLMDQALLVVAVRSPTVPRGASRLRVTLSSEHTDDEIDRLVRALKSLRG